MSNESAPHIARPRAEILPGMEKAAANLKAVIDELAVHPDVILWQTRLSSDDADFPEVEALENRDTVQAYNHARRALVCLMKSE